MNWPELGKRLGAAAENEREAKGAASIVIGIVDGSGLVWSDAVGYRDAARSKPADTAALYRIGPLTQLFTAILVMQFVERGQLDLDAPVQDYLADFKPGNPFKKPVTLRMLMNHRSGLVREPPLGSSFYQRDVSLTDAVRSLNFTTLVAAPGTVFKYSNAGTAVVGRVLEEVSGKAFEALLVEALLQPLSMQNSTLHGTQQVRESLATGEIAPQDASRFVPPIWDAGAAPASNLYSNLEDLAHFARALVNRGQADRGAILQADTLERMWAAPEISPDKPTHGIGFNRYQLDGHRVVGQAGSIYGYTADLAVFADDGFAVIALAGLHDATALLERLRTFAARQILSAQAGETPPDYVPSENAAGDAAPALAGHYQSGTESLEIRKVGGALFLEAPQLLAELRRLNGKWVLDDAATFSDELSIDPNTGTIRLGKTTFVRAKASMPPAPPEEFAPLIGEYGWEHIYFRVYERDGHPYVRTGWHDFELLERSASDRYRFAAADSRYAGEELRFRRDAQGVATSVWLNGVEFRRRDFGAEMLVKTRAVALHDTKLRDRALAATPAKPPSTLPADLVALKQIEPGLKLDIRYATTHNFMGLKFYDTAQAFLQRPAADALQRAHHTLEKYGFGIAIHDAYRPWYVTKMFWDATPEGGRDYVADPQQGSRHNRGCAADITLYELDGGEIVSMTGHYDEMSARSSPRYLGGTSQQRWRRDLLKSVMEAEGFAVYPYEWWHFDYRGWEQYPVLNVTFDQIH